MSDGDFERSLAICFGEAPTPDGKPPRAKPGPKPKKKDAPAKQRPKKGWKHTEESKERMRQASIANGSRPPSRTGRKLSAEARKKIGDAHRGRKRPPRSAEWREKQRLAQTGKKHSQEAKDKMSKQRKGVKKSEAHRAAMSAAGKGRIIAPETRAKIAAAQKGKKFTEAHLANLKAAAKRRRENGGYRELGQIVSRANKNRQLSAEQKAKIGAARIGTKHSAETRKKMSDSHKKRWEKKQNEEG